MVVDNDAVFIAFAKNSHQPVSAHPTDVKAFAGDLAMLLARLSKAFGDLEHPGGTVLLGRTTPDPDAPYDVLDMLGFPKDAPTTEDEARNHPVLAPARNVGWKCAQIGPWMTFHRPNSAPVHIGILPWLTSDNFELIDPDPIVMAWRMQWLGAWLGSPYRARPGVTALAGMKGFISGRSPYWKPSWDHVEPIACGMHWERPYNWDSPSVEALQLDHTWMHGWDIKGQFLAAASGAMLPRDALRHTKLHDYDGSAGYWQIVVPGWAYNRVLPHPAGNYQPGETVWVTSPRMELLIKVANDYQEIAAPVILDSWTAPNPARLLRPWAERCRDMVAAAKAEPDERESEILGTAAKHAYAHAIAMLRSQDSTIRRPDWNDTINGHAASGMWLKLYHQYRVDNRIPIKIQHDMAYYPSSMDNAENDRPSTFDTSGRIGRFAYKKSVEL
jgi:hypothetical protein